MNTTFKSTFFWRIYLLLEENSVDQDWLDEELYYLLSDLKEDFPIAKNIEGYSDETVYFSFNCGDYQLQIEFTPELFTNIYLLKQEKKFLLGWWDNAHWHPYFLRIEELNLITEYVKRFDAKWSDSEFPFLLFFSFLCVTDDDTEQRVKKKIKVIFDSFNLKLGGMVEQDFHFLYKAHKDYHWHLDSESDWVVLANRYGAYSLRHKLYEEQQKFPFEEWKDMISQIEKALNNN
jgi:hypothetical protein